MVLHGGPGHAEWVGIHNRLTEWGLEMDQHPDLGLKQTLTDQIRECNVGFSKYVEKNYRHWLESEKRPPLSVDVVDRFLIPRLQEGKSVFFFVIDCLRLDQWMEMETILREYFDIAREYHFSILPTATPYSRNSIFSGTFPDEIEVRFPEVWAEWEDDDTAGTASSTGSSTPSWSAGRSSSSRSRST